MAEIFKGTYIVLRSINTDYDFLIQAEDDLKDNFKYITVSSEIPIEIPLVSQEEITKRSLEKLIEQERIVNSAAQMKLNEITEQRTKLLALTQQIEEL